MSTPSQSEFDSIVEAASSSSGRIVRCLSLWQPWASLMACGGKWIETRGRNTKVRGEIYIHAGATKIPAKEMLKASSRWISLVEETLGVCADKWLTDLPYGAIIAKGTLSGTMPVERAELAFPDQVPFGNFQPGRYAHFYESLTAITPIPWKGSQGFFFARLSDAPTPPSRPQKPCAICKGTGSLRELPSKALDRRQRLVTKECYWCSGKGKVFVSPA